MPELYTTLKLLRAHDACKNGYAKCKKALGPGWGNDTPVPLSRIVESNGLDDALWCLRATTPDSPQWWREYALDCAEHVLPIFEVRYPEDKRPRLAIEMARKYLRGEVDVQAVKDAADAAAYADADADAYAAYAEAERQWQTQHFLEMSNA